MKKTFAFLVIGSAGLSIVSASIYALAGTAETSVTIGKREQPRVINAARAGDWARITAMQLVYEELIRQSVSSGSSGGVTTTTTPVVTSTPPVAVVPVIPPPAATAPGQIVLPTPTPKKPLFALTRTLKSGMRGADVAQLQRALQTKKIPLIVPRGQEGIFGPRTTVAVKLFQKQNRLKQTGIVDLATADAINR